MLFTILHMFYIFQPGYKLCSRAKRQYNTYYNTIAVKCHSCCSTWPGGFLFSNVQKMSATMVSHFTSFSAVHWSDWQLCYVLNQGVFNWNAICFVIKITWKILVVKFPLIQFSVPEATSHLWYHLWVKLACNRILWATSAYTVHVCKFTWLLFQDYICCFHLTARFLIKYSHTQVNLLSIKCVHK